MYAHYYGLRELPFGITPDTDYYFAHASQQEALNTLLVAIRMGEGFLKITGEVGTGKTLLCRKLLSTLSRDPGFATAYVPNPYLEPRTLMRALAEEVGLSVSGEETEHALARRLTLRLADVHASGRRLVLCLDEAQAMPDATLEALRLISNLETEKQKLIQIVLFGQPELDERLARHQVRQLRQRIAFSCCLSAFSADDTQSYLRHRLAVAGYTGPPLFTGPAIRVLYRASGGIPRLINILAHKALMAAYGEGARLVHRRHLVRARDDTESLQTRGRGWGFFRSWGHR
ncbi:MAG: AAA family ATPase [Gammaproteobacteria bacterium]|nr:AAA family ATPase [Gammaproteobacteria bacterium]